MATAGAAVTGEAVDMAVGCNWERAAEWLTAICVVTFDLELGQALEVTNWAYLLI